MLLSRVPRLHAGCAAFAVVSEHGEALAWGHPQRGGDCSMALQTR